MKKIIEQRTLSQGIETVRNLDATIKDFHLKTVAAISDMQEKGFEVEVLPNHNSRFLCVTLIGRNDEV